MRRYESYLQNATTQTKASTKTSFIFVQFSEIRQTIMCTLSFLIGRRGEVATDRPC